MAAWTPSGPKRVVKNMCPLPVLVDMLLESAESGCINFEYIQFQSFFLQESEIYLFLDNLFLANSMKALNPLITAKGKGVTSTFSCDPL